MKQIFKRIDTIFLRVKNIEESLKWYEEIMDLEIRWKSENYAAFNLGETAFTIYEPENITEFKPSEYATFNFYVSNITEAYDNLKSKGVELGSIEDGGGVQWFWFKDISGNRLEVCYFRE
ncbi:VOC family protein [Sporosalibacterium faouarense]|uniref:VOC family protein n=1 Tax=Sporosalibacterium faouarense TaxID=516123 RepID=UPI00192B8149|nr:VOC family protein [Sporosalibacterium faouarense]